MINYLKLLVFVFLFSCSLGDVGGFWTKEKDLKNERLEFKPLFEKDKFSSQEFNTNFVFSLSKKDIKLNNNSEINNNDGYVLFDGVLQKIQKYNFSKIKNFYSQEPSLIFSNDNIIFFDDSGSILSFNKNSKLTWKINNYSKSEKKIGPLISMIENKGQLYVSDNLSKFYKVDIKDKKIVWSKKNEIPFNSKIKFYEDKIYIVDTNNDLNCFSALNGNLLWKHTTEKSFINSSKKLSILIKDKLVIFSNSLGDITAVNANNGSLVWQKFTQNSKIYEDIMTLKTSNLIEDNGSIYFSNNKNQFYSLDLNTGIINWIQDINSNIKPAVIAKFIFTISLDGYFFIIEKDTGNILRITDVFKQLRINKNEIIQPTGFIFNHKNLFISTSEGKLIIVNIKTGKVQNILKISNDIISRPFVQNKKMYLIKDNSIIKLN